MIDFVANYGKELKPPSYHEVRITFLKKEVDRVQLVDLEKNIGMNAEGPDVL